MRGRGQSGMPAGGGGHGRWALGGSFLERSDPACLSALCCCRQSRWASSSCHFDYNEGRRSVVGPRREQSIGCGWAVAGPGLGGGWVVAGGAAAAVGGGCEVVGCCCAAGGR